MKKLYKAAKRIHYKPIFLVEDELKKKKPKVERIYYTPKRFRGKKLTPTAKYTFFDLGLVNDKEIIIFKRNKKYYMEDSMSWKRWQIIYENYQKPIGKRIEAALEMMPYPADPWWKIPKVYKLRKKNPNFSEKDIPKTPKLALKKIISQLKKNKIKFLIHGSHFFSVHKEPMASKDFDFIIVLDKKVIRKIFKIFKELLAIPEHYKTEEEFFNVFDEKIKSQKSVQLMAYYFGWHIDIWFFPKDDFQRLWKNRLRARRYPFKKFEIYTISADDLIVLKKKRLSDRDKLHIKEIEEMKRKGLI
jgi:hypothetical protein